MKPYFFLNLKIKKKYIFIIDFLKIMSPSVILLSKSLKSIGAGLACSGFIGAGAGIGIVFNSLIKAYAINPRLKNQLFAYAIMGFALAEAIGLLSIVMACIILYT
jgi:F-type H+-transporting ATPase subunit c